MTARWLCLTFLFAGCARNIPSSKPIPANAELIHRQTLGRDQAIPLRERLDASLRAQQVRKETAAQTQQQTWETQVFAASPNVTAKVTTMINPIDAKGRVMEQQILTYYDHGVMRYATNFFDKAKSP